jgi:hypothetical protein
MSAPGPTERVLALRAGGRGRHVPDVLLADVLQHAGVDRARRAGLQAQRLLIGLARRIRMDDPDVMLADVVQHAGVDVASGNCQLAQRMLICRAVRGRVDDPDFEQAIIAQDPYVYRAA